MEKRINIKITQLKSVIGSTKRKKGTVKALGLRRIRHSVIHELTPEIEGMVNHIKELVSVEVVK